MDFIGKNKLCVLCWSFHVFVSAHHYSLSFCCIPWQLLWFDFLEALVLLFGIKTSAPPTNFFTLFSIAVFVWIASPVSPENTSSCGAWSNQWAHNFWRYNSMICWNVLLFVILYYTSAFSLLTIFSTTSMYATLAVSPGQPSLISDDADVVALIGTSKDLAKQINQKEVHWGVCYASVGLFST